MEQQTYSSHLSNPTLALTMGDPNGIGPEVLIKALEQLKPFKAWRPLVFGDLRVLNALAERLGSSLSFIQVHEPSDSADVLEGSSSVAVLDGSIDEGRYWELGKVSKWAGASAFQFLKAAIDTTVAKQTHAIVTAPICKESLHLAGHRFPGHTEILSHYTNQARPIMMLVVEPLRAIHVTTHVSLRDALSLITTERVLETIQLAEHALQKMGMEHPRLAVPGLNPHAGENGLFGDEEMDVILPAIEQARSLGIDCKGPVPPDTVFIEHRQGHYDAVIALYHDQAHIPLKLYGFERGVNVTLNLPIIRTSVDHGTAFERAPSLTADPTSMIHAIRLALKML